MPTIPAIRIQRQEDHDFKMNLAYIREFKVSLTYASKPCLKKKGVCGCGGMTGSSVAECLPSIYKAFNSIPGINKKN